jgi:hypothetical protein
MRRVNSPDCLRIRRAVRGARRNSPVDSLIWMSRNPKALGNHRWRLRPLNRHQPFRLFIRLAVAFLGSRLEAAPHVVGSIAQRGSLTSAPAQRRIFWRMRSARSSSLIDMCRWIAVQ